MVGTVIEVHKDSAEGREAAVCGDDEDGGEGRLTVQDGTAGIRTTPATTTTKTGMETERSLQGQNHGGSSSNQENDQQEPERDDLMKQVKRKASDRLSTSAERDTPSDGQGPIISGSSNAGELEAPPAEVGEYPVRDARMMGHEGIEHALEPSAKMIHETRPGKVGDSGTREEMGEEDAAETSMRDRTSTDTGAVGPQTISEPETETVEGCPACEAEAARLRGREHEERRGGKRQSRLIERIKKLARA